MHPAGLVEHDLEEPGAEALVLGGMVVLQGFEEAEQGGERGAKLVARIGDEIGPHLLGRMGLAAVDQADEAGAVLEEGGGHLPAALALAEADQFGAGDPLARLAVARAHQPLGRGRVADGEPDVHPLDMLAKHRAGGGIGIKDAAIADDQQRIVDRFHQFQRVGERRQARGLDRLFGRAVRMAGGPGDRDRDSAAEDRGQGSGERSADQQRQNERRCGGGQGSKGSHDPVGRHGDCLLTGWARLRHCSHPRGFTLIKRQVCIQVLP